MKNNKKYKEVIAGNLYNKYTSKNPIVKKIMDNYLSSLDDCLNKVEINSALDVGCGEGHLTNYIKRKKRISEIQGVDSSEIVVKEASISYPDIPFFVESVYDLHYQDNSFDIVIALEILEHLGFPAVALKEIKRVAKEYCLFSVPREPLWRILNLTRAKYIRNFGNTPGHLQNWRCSEFIELLEKEFSIIKILKPMPWIMILCGIDKG